jgi:hypothetical protein
MAESVKRRVAAARLAVAFVAAGTIAGATAWAQASPPPPTAKASAFDAFLKIKSTNVVNGSLLYQDFAKGQVPSFNMFEKLDKSFTRFSKGFDNTYKPQFPEIKGELNTVNGDLNTIKGELGSFVKTGDAIMGDGSVFTGDGLVSNQLIGLLDVPNLVSVQGIGQKIRITNTSNGDLQHTACTDPQGGVIPPGTLVPTGFIECDATGGMTQSMQLFTGGVKPTVATVSFSSINLPSGSQDIVQILVGL